MPCITKEPPCLSKKPCAGQLLRSLDCHPQPCCHLGQDFNFVVFGYFEHVQEKTDFHTYDGSLCSPVNFVDKRKILTFVKSLTNFEDLTMYIHDI